MSQVERLGAPLHRSPFPPIAFTICSFWLVSALLLIGEQSRARQLCEKLLSLASPLKLYAEEIDPNRGRPRHLRRAVSAHRSPHAP